MAPRKTARSRNYESMILEAKNTLGAGRKNLKGFEKAEKGKKKKRVTQGTLTALASSISAFQKARKSSAGKKTQKKGSTLAETKARTALLVALTSIRGDIETTYDDDPKDPIHEAAGRGRNLTTKSSQEALDSATFIAGGLTEDAETAKRAADAGVGKARIGKVEALVTALEQAMGVHQASGQESETLTREARAALRAMQKQATHVTKTARSVFKGTAIVTQFAPITRAHAIKHRAPKNPPGEQTQILVKGSQKQASGM